MGLGDDAVVSTLHDDPGRAISGLRRRRTLAAALIVQTANIGFIAIRDHWWLGAGAGLALWQVPRRRRLGLPVGLRGRQALGLTALILGILAAWPWVMEAVMALAADMRAVLPHSPDAVMLALPGNDPRPVAEWLGAERHLGRWSDLYLAAFTAMPLGAIAWTAAKGRRAAALLLAWSHPGCLLICLPLFILWPVSDPWQQFGWYGGLPCPWWWQGMHERLLTFTFPSLHVAVAVVVAAVMSRLDRRWSWRGLWWSWVALVALSTLALRTHWIIDIPAGALAGYLTYLAGCRWLRWHWRSGKQTVRIVCHE